MSGRSSAPAGNASARADSEPSTRITGPYTAAPLLSHSPVGSAVLLVFALVWFVLAGLLVG